MLIFGGIDASGGMLDDVFCLSFTEPISSSGAGAGPAIEALGTYPDALMLSLWERLFANLQTLGQQHGRALSRLQGESTDIEDKVCELENQLAADERVLAEAERSLRETKWREAKLREQLTDKRRSTALAMASEMAQIKEQEAQADALRQQLARLQGVQALLGSSRQLPPIDVAVNADDCSIGCRLGPEELGLAVARRAGTWRGAQVTVEELPLPASGLMRRFGREDGTGTVDLSATDLSGSLQRQPTTTFRRQTREDSRDSTLALGRTDLDRKASRVAKETPKAPKLTASALEEVARRELQMAARLRHPNLVEYFGIAPGGDRLLVVAEPPLVPLALELRRSGSRRLKQNATRVRLALDVALALEYLHSSGVAHRRVAPEQVLMRDAPTPTAKLGGFFIARVAAWAAAASGEVPKLQEAGDARSADVLGYGAMLAELVVTEGLKKQKSSISVGKIGNGALRLVAMKCMEKDPRHRMSASMIARAMRCVERGELVVRVDAIPGDPSRSHPLVDAGDAFEASS